MKLSYYNWQYHEKNWHLLHFFWMCISGNQAHTYIYDFIYYTKIRYYISYQMDVAQDLIYATFDGSTYKLVIPSESGALFKKL